MLRLRARLLAALLALHAGAAGAEGAGRAAPGGPAKEISARQARGVLGDLRDALTTEEARAEIAAARGGGAAPADPKAAAQAAMPAVERLAQAALGRHGFAGLSEAMSAAARAGKREYDTEVRRLLEAIGEAITGERKAGRVPELAALAGEFVEMDEAARAEALERAERVVDGLTVDGELTVPGAEIYLEAMRGIADGGKSYAEDAVVELALRVAQAAEARAKAKAAGPPPAEDVKALNRRLNVFTEFLKAADHRRVQQRIKDARKKGARGRRRKPASEL